jgi:prepilin-type processing-associated H-X9-DG protein
MGREGWFRALRVTVWVAVGSFVVVIVSELLGARAAVWAGLVAAAASWVCLGSLVWYRRTGWTVMVTFADGHVRVLAFTSAQAVDAVYSLAAALPGIRGVEVVRGRGR